MVTCVLCFPRRLKRVQVENLPSKMSADTNILIPRGCTPFGQHQESRPLGRSNDIPVLNGFVNTIDWDQNQSDLSDFTLSMRRVTGSPWIADFRCWTRPEVAILGADQKERGLWGREWTELYYSLLRWKSNLTYLVLSTNMPGTQPNSGRILLWFRLAMMSVPTRCPSFCLPPPPPPTHAHTRTHTHTLTITQSRNNAKRNSWSRGGYMQV